MLFILRCYDGHKVYKQVTLMTLFNGDSINLKVVFFNLKTVGNFELKVYAVAEIWTHIFQSVPIIIIISVEKKKQLHFL